MKIPKIVESKISFDFDGTLDDDFDDTPNPQKEEIISICKHLLSEGKDVCIITKRYDPKTGLNESDKVFDLAKKIGVKNVYFTNRELKHKKIAELGIQLHFENSQPEADIIQAHSPSTLLVVITDPYWRDLVY